MEIYTFHIQVLSLLIIAFIFTFTNTLHNYWFNRTPKKFQNASKQTYKPDECKAIVSPIYVLFGVALIHLYLFPTKLTFIPISLFLTYWCVVVSRMYVNNIHVYKTLITKFKKIKYLEDKAKLDKFLDVKEDDYDPFNDK